MSDFDDTKLTADMASALGAFPTRFDWTVTDHAKICPRCGLNGPPKRYSRAFRFRDWLSRTVAP